MKIKLHAECPSAVRDYYDWFATKRLWSSLRWCGFSVAKTPSDMWLYQEMLTELRPQRIVEFGTCCGGTALFFCDVLDALKVNGAKVLTIDMEPRFGLPSHPRLTKLLSKTQEAEAVVQEFCADCGGHVLLIEDAEHSHEHVLSSLRRYWDRVTVGSYFVVEDTGLTEWRPGHPLPGVAQAIEDFLAEQPQFEIDWRRERFGHTESHGGFLRRTR